MPKRAVRASFRNGDQVKVTSGSHTGLVGWVINCSMGHGDKQVTVVNQSTDSETIVLESQLDFHDGDFIMLTLRVRRPGRNVKLGERDPNEVYIGKQIIVHGTHRLKGYRGLIRATTPNGVASVEVNATHKVEKIEFAYLAIVGNEESSWSTMRARSLLSSDNTGPSSNTVDTSSLQPPSTPFVTTVCPDSTSPAWDPSSRTPGPRELSPLAPEPRPPTPLPPYSTASVSDWLNTITSKDVESLVPVHPSGVKEMVTPLTGDLIGQRFIVKEYNINKCIIHVPGVRLRKGQQDPAVATLELARIDPGSH
ncbi:hypothetical protein CPB84DRAFT_1755471 [Gymnopilus junonius]|uniref:KOW domain-containing protein n=1 Tax=Gymnopilus junonius TaxID=109634 RepID=A0A9P5TFS1_GYMJU|nr:hypothetical protein CPB84DRAFT_1755471 [Gymnopilus junonius]